MLRNFWITVSTLTVVLGVCAWAWADLPAFELADVAKADLSDGWGQAVTDGGVRCRVAAKGGRRMVDFPAWWSAQAVRPPAGKVYVFEIRYRDTAAAPVIVYAQGGLGRYLDATEVHRFGGSGDGEWKTAAVPVGWDQLLRIPGKPTRTGLGFRADADLPIASIKARPARPGDEQRYNAETRAWVAKVQAAKRRATALKLEPRKFGAGKLGPIVPFAWPALAPLLPNAQPKDEQVGAPVRIRMCLNELEGGSFGVYANGADLTNVDYEVSALTGPGGKLVADVIRRTAEVSLMQRTSGGKDYVWFPKRLWPAFKVDVPAGRSQWFVFNLRTHRGRTKPGAYRGAVTITSDQGQTRLPVVVEVLPIDLLTMNEAGLFMGGCARSLLPAHDFEFAVDYNQNGTQVWFAGVQPKMSIVDDRLRIDFTYLDEWMRAAKQRGCQGVVWFLGGNPYGFPHTMSIFRDLAEIDTRGGHKPLSVNGWVRKQAAEANRDKPLPRDRELFKQWVRLVDQHARQAGWPEIILTPFDEPAKWIQGPYKKEGYEDYPGNIGTGPWIKTYFKDVCAAIREAAPDIRIYGSIHHTNRRRRNEGYVFIPDIDLFCTNAIHEDLRAGDKVRAAGKTLWQYSNTGTGSAPDRARFTFGFYFAAFDSRGSLAWAYNWGQGFDATRGYNWMYVWHTPFDTIPAPYYEGMREAWDDRRIIETYKKKFASDPQAMAVLEGIFKEASRSRTKGGRDTVKDFWAAIDDVNKLDRWRKELLDRLAKD